MKSTLFSKRNFLVAFLVIILAGLEYLIRYNLIPADLLLIELTITRLILCFVVGYMLVIQPNKKWNHHSFLRLSATSFVFGFVILTLAFVLIDPRAVVNLGLEDNLIENLSAAFLFIASIVAVGVGVKFYKSKNLRLTLVFGFVALALFIMGMEEISWMQRILDVSAGSFMSKYNMQGEINFHNLHTRLFNDLFYLGAFLLFTVATVYHKSLKSILGKYRFGWLDVLLPSYWLLIPFSLSAGLTTPFYHIGIVRMAIYVLTFLILLSELVKVYKTKKNVHYIYIFTIVLLVLGVLLSNFSEVAGINRNSLQEYREMIIALGLLAYLIDIRLCITKTRHIS